VLRGVVGRHQGVERYPAPTLGVEQHVQPLAGARRGAGWPLAGGRLGVRHQDAMGAGRGELEVRPRREIYADL
jgi:hypothetical protein